MTRGGRGTAPDRLPEPPAGWLLWLSVLGAPTVWLVHFLLFYVTVEVFCAAPDAARAPGSGPDAAVWILGIGTLAFAAAAIALTLVAVRIGRRALRTREAYDDFLPRVGVIAGTMAAFVLLLEAVPLLFVRVCG